jgi:hypothetical protein
MTRRATSRLLFWIGLLCTLTALIPRYTHTPQEMPADLPSREKLGPFGKFDDGGQTELTFGLPFSPWFVWSKSVVYKTSPLDIGGAIKTSGPAEVKGTNFSININENWHVEFLSWSMALAILGIVLIVVAKYLRPPPPLPIGV